MRILYLFLTKQKILTVQNLWQVHYQILSIISQKEFAKLNFKDCDCFIDRESVKDNSIKYECLSCKKDYSKKINE